MLLAACGNGGKVKDAIAKGDQALEAKDYAAAIAAYDEALKLDSKSEEAKKQKEAAQQKVKETEDLIAKAKKSIQDTDYDAAIKQYEEAVALNPKSTDASTGLENAKKAQGLGKYIEAVQALPEAIRISEAFEDVSIDIDKDYQEMHELIIKVANSQVQALTEIVAAIENADTSKITSANELLSTARENERKYVQEITNKAKELGIPME